MNEKETKDKEQVPLHTITTEYTCSNSKQWINAENKHTIDRTLTKKIEMVLFSRSTLKEVIYIITIVEPCLYII
jgi:hypothetical protein